MAIRNGVLAPVALAFLAGAIVMMFFVVLSGVSNTTPLSNTYFLRADTSGIPGARDISQWAYFYVCGDGNTDCGVAWPDPPIGYAWDGDGAAADQAPPGLVGEQGGGTTSHYYFFMWRFGWVFYLMGLALAVLSLLGGAVLTCCGRLGAAVTGAASLAALFFYTIAVALMTACFAQMRNAFLAAGRDAQIGTWAFGFSWGAWAALFISTTLLCLGTRKHDRSSVGGGASGGGIGAKLGLGRKRSVRSRRSYDMGSRRVKDEYA